MREPMEDSLDLPLRDVLEHMQKRMMHHSSYFGVQAWKCPTDFWMYQEILFETRPDVIIEIGCNRGGGTLALHHLCQNLGHGRVIGIDISLEKIAPAVAAVDGIHFIESDASQCFDEVRDLIGEDERVMVIEDSEHTYATTLSLLRQYSALIKPGDYFIVEDSICDHGLVIPNGPRPGPYEAIEAFIAENPDFVIDRERERFLITWNPKGYLQRVR
ncbi:MAG: CmcI family methyltransferase [Pseudomonadota bacterium]